MTGDTVGVQDGFHDETRAVSALTSRVANTKDGWHRGDNLNVPGTTMVSEIYTELSTLIATYGALAQNDTSAFDTLGVTIRVRDAEDAGAMGVCQ